MSIELKKRNSSFSQSNSTLFIAISFAAILVSALLPFPRPLAISSQPWRVELLAAIFVIAMIIGVFWRGRDRAQPAAVDRDNVFRLVCLFMGGFVLWSGLSLIWAQSAGSAVHHTLTWGIYLSVMIASVAGLRRGHGYSVIIATFTMAAGIMGVLCLVDYLTIIDFATAEGALRQRYAKFAEMLVAILPILAAAGLYARGRRSSLLLFGATMLGWLVVMLSLSRGAFLAGVVGFAIVFTGCALFSQKQYRKRVLLVAGGWLVVTVATQLFFTVSSLPSTTEYLTGPAEKARLSSATRVLTWQAGREMAATHMLTGVGADNFGVAFNTARALHAQKAQTATPEIAEDIIVERAHNEFLQIFAELGLFGFLLFVGLVGVIAVSTARVFLRNRFRLPPILWGSLAGMAAFLASSLVSSFSFRVVQNGTVFVLIAAVALHEITKMAPRSPKKASAGARWQKPIIAGCFVLAILMVVYCATKAAGEYYVNRAEQTQELAAASDVYRTALSFDPDNANAYYFLGFRYASEGDHKKAATLLREAIDRGLGVTLTYSMLSSYQDLAGDVDSANKTLTEGLSVFPNSVFLRVRYALFLEERAQTNLAANQLEIAKAIDTRQANGWYSLIKSGSTAAFHEAQGSSETAPPAELLPDNAVRQYLDKGQVKE